MITYTTDEQANKLIRSYLKGRVTRDELLWELRYEIRLPESVVRDLVRNCI